MTDTSIETQSASTTEQEKIADLYGPKYLRENEIRTVHNLLQTHPIVMVLGGLGRGKSTFISEALWYTRDRQKHGRFTHASFLFDIHSIDGHILYEQSSLYRTYDYINPDTPQAKIRAIQDTTRPLIEWLDHQPKGERLQDLPFAQRSILYLDAGDALFLSFNDPLEMSPIYQQMFPSLHSPEWEHLERLRGAPDTYRATFKMMVTNNLKEQKRSLNEHRRIVLANNLPNISTIASHQQRLDYYTNLEQDELYVDDLMGRYEIYRAFQKTRDDLLDKIKQTLAEGKIRLVLTDHNYNRKRLLVTKPQRADPYLLDKYDSLFALAYRYDLPSKLQADKARLALQRQYGLNNPVLQDEIIVATGGSHRIIKLAINPGVIATLQKITSADERNATLIAIVEPFKREIEA